MPGPGCSGSLSATGEVPHLSGGGGTPSGSTLRLLILRMGLFPITSSSSSHAEKLRSVLAWVTMLPSFSPRLRQSGQIPPDIVGGDLLRWFVRIPRKRPQHEAIVFQGFLGQAVDPLRRQE